MSHPAEPSRVSGADAAAASASVELARASDVRLFAAAQAGDYAAFEELVRRYHERVYRLVVGMLKSATDAEEVLQETFLNVFRNLRNFKNQSAPGSWVYRIA